jgi:large subunit ribosomal protein L21
MKKAVIVSGGLQYLVTEGEELLVNYLGEVKSQEYVPIMIVDGNQSIVDETKLKSVKVSVDVIDEARGDKVIALRYKAKKRVQTRRGHRQKYSKIKVVSIK